MKSFAIKSIALCGLAAAFAFVAQNGASSLVAQSKRPRKAAPAPKGKKESRMIYIGTYSAGKSKGVYMTRLDMETGALSKPELVAEASNPSFLAVHPSGKYLYAVNEDNNFKGEKSGAVSAFSVNKGTGKLTPLNQVSSQGGWPCHIFLDKTGNFALVANYASGSLSVLPIQEDGHLLEVATHIQHTGHGPNKARQEAAHAHSMNLDSANHFAIAADLGLDSVFSYKFDSDNGALTQASVTKMPAGTGPRHFAFHPSEKFAYANGELNSTVNAMTYDAKTGALKIFQTLSTLPKDYHGTGNTTAEIRVHPSGKYLYCSNRVHDSIAMYAIDQKTGKLTYLGNESTKGKIPRNFNIDPTGTYLLAANQESDSVVSFRIDAATGKLSPTGHQIEVGKPVCVRFYLSK